MTVAKKLKLEEVKNQSVLGLSKEKMAMEIAVGGSYYLLYPLPGDTYSEFMGVMRSIWYKLLSEKETKYTDAIAGAKALSQNMGEIDDQEVMEAVAGLMTKLTDSKEVHPLEFLSHPEFGSQVKQLNALLLDGCDEEDIAELTTPQQARLMEVCFLQNFMPFVRLASNASRIFRGGS